MNSDIIVLLIAIAATVTASIAIVKFGHFLRDRSVHVMEQVPETSVWAAVMQKDLVESDSGETPLSGTILFRCSGGQELRFRVDMGTFEQAQVGQQGELVYRNQMFLGFSDPNAPEEMDPDKATDVMDFSYTSFDERIDQEIPLGLTRQDVANLEGKGLPNQDDPMLEGLYQKKIEMPMQMYVLRAQADSLDRFPALQLLSRSQLPNFLKAETKIHEQFRRVYTEALANLRSQDNETPKGLASEWMELRSNVFFLQIVMQEFPAPAKHQVAGRFFINLKREEGEL